MTLTRTLISSGSPLEFELGYSRGVETGDYIFISGCTAQGPDGNIVTPGDAYGQTRFVFEKMARALAQAGAGLEDLVRTRVYLTRDEDWEPVGRAHGEALRDVRPSCTMVQVSRLLRPGLLVEIEAVALKQKR